MRPLGAALGSARRGRAGRDDRRYHRRAVRDLLRCLPLVILLGCRPPTSGGTGGATTSTSGGSGGESSGTTDACMSSSECDTDGICVADYTPPPEGPAGGARDPPGRAEDQRARRDHGARGDERARPDHAALADHRAVEDRRLDPDQRAAADRAAVDHRAVADHDLLGDEGAVTIAEVDHRAVLDVAALPDLDAVHVAAEDAAVPDAHLVAEPHVADHGRASGDPHALPDDRRTVEIALDQRAWKSAPKRRYKGLRCVSARMRPGHLRDRIHDGSRDHGAPSVPGPPEGLPSRPPIA